MSYVAFVLLANGVFLFVWADKMHEVGFEVPFFSILEPWEIFSFDKALSLNVDSFYEEPEVAHFCDDDVECRWRLSLTADVEIL